VKESVHNVLSVEMGSVVGRILEKTTQEYVLQPYHSLLDDYLSKQAHEVEVYQSKLDRFDSQL